MVLRGGTHGAEGGVRDAETGVNATGINATAPPLLSSRSVRNSEGIDLTPSASLMPSSSSSNDAEGAIHAELKARFVNPSPSPST